MNRHYQILGLTSAANLKQIKKAYRRLVMQYHPDRNASPDAKKKFIEIDQAYDYLVRLKSGRGKSFSFKSKQNKRPKSTNRKPQTPPERMTQEEFLRAEQKAKIKNRFLQKIHKANRKSSLLGGVTVIFWLVLVPILVAALEWKSLFGWVVLTPFPISFFTYWIIYKMVKLEKDEAYRIYVGELRNLK